MKKLLDLKMPGVMGMGREELREVDGGIIPWILGFIVSTTITACIPARNSIGERGITEAEYQDCFEGCTGVPYDG